MPLEMKRKPHENIQTLTRRFQKAIQQSGILLEVRHRQFVQRSKSPDMQKKSALRKLKTKKHYATLKKMRKI